MKDLLEELIKQIKIWAKEDVRNNVGSNKLDDRIIASYEGLDNYEKEILSFNEFAKLYEEFYFKFLK